MAVATLLISHTGVGTALAAAAQRLFGPVPLPLRVIEIDYDADPDASLLRIGSALREIGGEDGVLILTDLYGATPANIARKAAHLGCAVRRVSGLSLPMLLRVFNYPDVTLDELARIAAGGGRLGVVADDA